MSSNQTRRKPILLVKRENFNKGITPSILSKRNFDDAFYLSTYDDNRYGQHISDDFFKNNTGHDVLQEMNPMKSNENIKKDELNQERGKRDSETKYDPDELIQWCEYYLANRNLFNV